MNPNELFPTAIQMLVCLAEEPRRHFSVEELAEALGLKVTTARRILRAFKRQGVVKLKLGTDGGWIIARHPREISLGQAYEASGVNVLPPLRPLTQAQSTGLSDAHSSKGGAGDESPVAGAISLILQEAEALLISRFERVSLKDLMDQIKVFRTH